MAVELYGRPALRCEFSVCALSVGALTAAGRAWTPIEGFDDGARLFDISFEECRITGSCGVHAKAHALAIGVRAATRTFPRTGFASLKTQMTSAAESIAFNIVEGCGAASQKEFARFLDIGIKSTMELESQLRLARDYRVLAQGEWEQLTGETVDARRMLSACELGSSLRLPQAPVVTQ